MNHVAATDKTTPCVEEGGLLRPPRPFFGVDTAPDTVSDGLSVWTRGVACCVLEPQVLAHPGSDRISRVLSGNVGSAVIGGPERKGMGSDVD